MLESRTIYNEFGHYVGVCVCEIKIVRSSQTLVEFTETDKRVETTEMVAELTVVETWMTHDEEYSFGLAEGFIQGMKRPRPANIEEFLAISSGECGPLAEQT